MRGGHQEELKRRCRSCPDSKTPSQEGGFLQRSVLLSCDGQVRGYRRFQPRTITMLYYTPHQLVSHEAFMEDTAARPETTAVISTFPLIRRRPILSYGTGMQHKHC